MENLSEKRTCPQCKKEFLPKKNSQIYDLAECRIAFNNNLNNTLRIKLSSINKQLIKNFKVLDVLLNNKNEAKANKHFLRGAGFSFKNFTHVAQNENGFVYGVYEILFYKINEEEYLIYRTND